MAKTEGRRHGYALIRNPTPHKETAVIVDKQESNIGIVWQWVCYTRGYSRLWRKPLQQRAVK